ncbi:NAD(P)-binding protein [Pleurostoma richardsiae]|uniref:NAD(P)-binding protein n=1 Tax=Pleurostoma richardsiae TaxID=41990 RepID=A0AA38VIA8_9PEZI|nr:NAD(P)-binding protein [Pleurostoma richardsiae]
MAQKYAKDQPAGFTNHIERVAIVGAGGQIGRHMTAALLASGKHTITALTRPNSTSKLPAGLKVVPVDYTDEAALVAALAGQQFLIITLAFTAPPDTHSRIVRAAAAAGVPYVMPNVYTQDLVANEKFGAESLMGPVLKAHVDEIVSLGVSAPVVLVTGFWYEFSLAAGEPWYGIDVRARRAVLFDGGGAARVNTTTWPQCGRGVAALLALKELPEDEGDAAPALSRFANGFVYVSSFRVSQREMLDSVQRVTGTKDADWEITTESAAERYKKGVEDAQKGNQLGFARSLYARAFFPSGEGDYETHRGLHNEVLGLPKEDLDEATKVAVKMVEDNWSPLG